MFLAIFTKINKLSFHLAALDIFVIACQKGIPQQKEALLEELKEFNKLLKNCSKCLNKIKRKEKTVEIELRYLKWHL